MDKQNETAAQLTRFREATRELDSVYAAFPKACGLSEAEYWSLVAVYEGLETQSRISAQLYLSRQTLNSAFRQLRRKGLVQLEPYADNQRSKRAVLTDDGPPFCGNKCPADAPHRGARLGEADRGGTPPAAGADPPVQRAGAPGACADRRAGSAPRNRCPCAIKYTWPLLLRPLAAGQAAVSVFAGVLGRSLDFFRFPSGTIQVWVRY